MLGLLVGQEVFEAGVVAVGTVDACFLAVDGEEDGVVAVAGGSGLVVVPVVASPSDVATVEYLGASSCGARDKAVSVVPVVGPSVDCSLSHFGVEL